MCPIYFLIGISLAIFSTQIAFADTPKKSEQEIATNKWLDLIDKGAYGESWDQASEVMKNTMKKEEWVQVMNATRKPMGAVNSRQLINQLPAKNPHGLPEGDYEVLYYKTSFGRKPDAKELITLRLEKDGWKVLTYQRD